MYGDDFPAQIKKEIRALAKDEIFQHRFGFNEKLDKLESLQYDPPKLKAEWQCFRNLPLKIKDMEFKHLTLGAICDLFALRSPFIVNACKPIDAYDIAIFFYVTQSAAYTPEQMNDEDLPQKALAWLASWKNLESSDLDNVITMIMTQAFQPLEMIPSNCTQEVGNVNVNFDSDWCASMVTIVHQMTGYSPREIMNLPVASCAWYYIQYAKQNGTEGICRKSNTEIIIEIRNETNRLILDRLEEKGVIDPKDRAYWNEVIKAPKNRKPGFKLRDYSELHK